jgi:hypothetical protein
MGNDLVNTTIGPPGGGAWSLLARGVGSVGTSRSLHRSPFFTFLFFPIFMNLILFIRRVL